MNDFKIIFVHGYTASSKADWYPSIAPELQKLDIDFSIPHLPGSKHPHADKWLEAIHEEAEKTDKPLVLVGHSLGTRAVLLYLEKYQPKVKLVLLIAAFANKLENAQRRNGEAYPDFFNHRIEIEAIRPLAEKFVVMHSRDDNSIAYEQGREIAGDLNAELISYNGRGHFCEPANAPYILETIKKELKV